MRKKIVNRRVWLYLLIVPFVALLMLWLWFRGQELGGKTLGGAVHGAVLADLGSKDEQVRFAVPEVNLYLKEAESGQIVDHVVTDRDGLFAFHRQTPGAYRLCWKEEGWLPECHPEALQVGADTFYVGAIQIRPSLPSGVIAGRLTLADGSPAGYVDAAFGVEDLPRIRLSDTDRSVPVDTIGRFLIATVPRADTRLEVQLGREMLRTSFQTKTLDFSGAAPLDLRSPNHRPDSPSAVLYRGGKPVLTSSPGVVLDVEARGSDPDGDALEYRWTVSAGELSAREGRIIRWTLPGSPGIYDLYILAADGRGGFTPGKVRISAGMAASTAANCQTLCQDGEGCPPWSGHPSSPFLAHKGIGSELEAERYYKAIDPENLRMTLGAWWEVNRFGSDGEGDLRASYLNHNDLGFGRDMNCKTNGDDVACYVTNYGCPDQIPANADLALARKPDTRGPTVAMEYSTVEGRVPNDRIVKFFVYAAGVDTSERIGSANLDEFGKKFVPQVCLECHGGTYKPTDPNNPKPEEIDLKASFREFDLGTFRYPGGRVEPNSWELKNFRRLNEDIVLQTAPHQAIRELVEGWYRSGRDEPDLAFTPIGWSPEDASKRELYLKVIAPSCRTCHVAFRSSSDGKQIDWSTYEGLQKSRAEVGGLLPFYVCGTSKIMPNAIVTYKNFWTQMGGERPKILGRFEAADWEPIGDCK